LSVCRPRPRALPAPMAKKRRTLIIKIGAAGDVLRTTPLLHKLSGDAVTWVTGRTALPLLAGNPRIARALTPGGFSRINGEKFDWVINFDESAAACRIASAARAPRKTGARLDRGKPVYCESSAPWFDMSLISRHGIPAADKLKYRARKSYQDYLFEACGFKFAGEEYFLPTAPAGALAPLVAVEKRAGPKWPLKHWPGYCNLTALFRKNHINFFILRQRKNLRDYISDIGRCTLLVSGDTLAMHLALALRKSAVAIFNCTSPWEIYGYGRLSKVVNPGLAGMFYSRRAFDGKGTHVAPQTVLRAVLKAAARTP